MNSSLDLDRSGLSTISSSPSARAFTISAPLMVRDTRLAYCSASAAVLKANAVLDICKPPSGVIPTGLSN